MFGSNFECVHLPYALPPALAAELAAAYGEPHRAYHNTTHIAELLRWFDTIADDVGWSEPEDVYTAILFHDAIYVPGAKDNEAKSAGWAQRAIAEHALPCRAHRVVEMIELTAQHGRLASARGDTALFLDSDMAIVAAPSAVYREYAQQIRREYAAIPDDAYRAGRRAFLASVAAKPRIFFTEYFHTRLDAQARGNLADEIATLGD
jgi:predicted metal-dependent HD superfamily phosphohydrolase